jgi:hypothetical protein
MKKNAMMDLVNKVIMDRFLIRKYIYQTEKSYIFKGELPAFTRRQRYAEQQPESDGPNREQS